MKRPTNPVDKRQHDIAVDTVKNPRKGMFLGGLSADEAKKILKKKFGYTDEEIRKLEKVKKSSAKDRLRSKIRDMVESVLNEGRDRQKIMELTSAINNYCEEQTDALGLTEQAEVYEKVAGFLSQRAKSIRSYQ